MVRVGHNGRVRNFLAGARMLGAGFGVILRSRRLLLLGALPALLSMVLLLGALGVLVYFAGDIASWLTPFADSWAAGWRIALLIVVGVMLVGAGALLGSVTFIAITLLIGGPVYEYIAERAEDQLGLDTRGDGASVARELGRGVRDSLKLLVMALLGSIVLFGIGLVPFVGTVTAPVLGALFGAWIITLEMIGLVFQRQGRPLAERRRMLRGHRATAFGFGLPTYLLCLIPVAQLVVIPSAVVGGTLLVHQLEGNSVGRVGGPAATAHRNS